MMKLKEVYDHENIEDGFCRHIKFDMDATYRMYDVRK